MPESALKVGNDIWKFVRDKFLERKLFGEGSDLVYARVDGVLDDTGNFILMVSDLPTRNSFILTSRRNRARRTWSGDWLQGSREGSFECTL